MVATSPEYRMLSGAGCAAFGMGESVKGVLTVAAVVVQCTGTGSLDGECSIGAYDQTWYELLTLYIGEDVV